MLVLTSLNSQYVHSNLAIRYLAGIAKRFDHPHQLIEFTINDSADHVLSTLYKLRPQVAAFSCYIWNIEDSLRLMDNLKKVLPSVLIIAGGPEVSYDPIRLLKDNHFLDLVISGEGEETFAELMASGFDPDVWGETAGLTWRNGTQVTMNSSRPLITNFDSIPRPYDIDFVPDGRIVYYETSRGCPFSCSYCLSSASKGVRYFPMERIRAEIKSLVASGVKQIKFVDRTFNSDRVRALEIMRFLAEIPGTTTYHFEIVADLLDEATLDWLANVRQGLFQFEIGVQSINPCTLASINRRQNLMRIKENILKLQSDHRIRIHIDLIAGLPFEDIGSFQVSFNWTYGLNPDYLQLGFLKLLKGTSIRLKRDDFDFVYKSYPPYEVLSNRWLSYQDILMLKVVEDLVQKYRNSGVFTQTLKYVVSHLYKGDAFRFFWEVAQFWSGQGLTGVPVKRERLYVILDQFLRSRTNNGVTTNQLIILDFVINNRNLNIPIELAPLQIQEQGKLTKAYLRDNKDSLPDTGHVNRPRIEVFAIDVLFYAEICGKSGSKTVYPVMFIYGSEDCLPVNIDL